MFRQYRDSLKFFGTIRSLLGIKLFSTVEWGRQENGVSLAASIECRSRHFVYSSLENLTLQRQIHFFRLKKDLGKSWLSQIIEIRGWVGNVVSLIFL